MGGDEVLVLIVLLQPLLTLRLAELRFAWPTWLYPGPKIASYKDGSLVVVVTLVLLVFPFFNLLGDKLLFLVSASIDGGSSSDAWVLMSLISASNSPLLSIPSAGDELAVVGDVIADEKGDGLGGSCSECTVTLPWVVALIVAKDSRSRSVFAACLKDNRIRARQVAFSFPQCHTMLSHHHHHHHHHPPVLFRLYAGHRLSTSSGEASLRMRSGERDDDSRVPPLQRESDTVQARGTSAASLSYAA